MRLENVFVKMATGGDFMTLLKVGKVDILCRKNKAYLGGFNDGNYESYEISYDWPYFIKKDCPVMCEYRSKISGVIWYVVVKVEEVISSHGDVCITVKKLGDVVTVYAAA